VYAPPLGILAPPFLDRQKNEFRIRVLLRHKDKSGKKNLHPSTLTNMCLRAKAPKACFSTPAEWKGWF
jgi:hypothetical protein